jgi:3-hydroxyacyl-CoA dehydrogenase
MRSVLITPRVAGMAVHMPKYALRGVGRYYSSATSGATRITLIGGGTIGASLAALHLEKALNSKPVQLTIYDNKSDLKGYLRKSIPLYMQHQFKSGLKGAPGLPKATEFFDRCIEDGTIKIDNDLASAVSGADIVEEQGPEVLDFKRDIWPKIEQHTPST